MPPKQLTTEENAPANHYNALHIAVSNYDLDQVRTLVANLPTDVQLRFNILNGHVPNPDPVGSTLHSAACKKPASPEEKVNCTKIVKLLIDSGADVEAEPERDNTPLMTACTQNNIDVGELLISYGGAKVNKPFGDENLTLLHLACARNLVEFADLLIANGANVDALTTKNIAPLGLACGLGRYDLAELLINHGADVNRNHAILGSACGAGRHSMVELLLLRGADIEGVGKRANEPTPLISAAKSNSNRAYDIVQLLINHGAQLDHVVANTTALYFACGHGNEEVMELLIAHGANVDICTWPRDNGLITPLALAKDSKAQQLMELLSLGIIL